jgi:hypothetical protein
MKLDANASMSLQHVALTSAASPTQSCSKSHATTPAPLRCILRIPAPSFLPIAADRHGHRPRADTMRPSDDLPLRSHPHPNPLASNAPLSVQVNGMAPEVPALRQPPQRHGASSPRPGTAATNASTSRVSDDQTSETHVAPSSRPGLLRARSDFGPRAPVAPPESVEGGSVDGHFKIRHGWDDQLNSEEYSNLLTSVRGIRDILGRRTG